MLLLVNRLTVADVARKLSRNPELVRRWLREGRLRGESFGGVWMIAEHELERFRRNEPEKRRRVHWMSKTPQPYVFHATVYVDGKPSLTMFCGVKLDKWRSRQVVLSPGIPDDACPRCLAIVESGGGPDGR
jgi:helix-turn-helix protein